MYGCESWAIRKAECRRIEAFKLWCWDSNEIKPNSLKGNQPWILDWCWSWNFNTLATWYEDPTHWKRPWCWERLRAGKAGIDRGWDGWMTSPIQWAWVWANSRDSAGGKPGVLQSMGSKDVGHNLATEQWTKPLSQGLLLKDPRLSHRLSFLTPVFYHLGGTRSLNNQSSLYPWL